MTDSISCSTCRYWVNSEENLEWGFCKLSDPSVPETLNRNIIVIKDQDDNLFEVELQHKEDMKDIGKVELHPKFDGKQMIMVIQPL